MTQISRYPSRIQAITQSYRGSYSHSRNYNGTPRDYPIDDNCGDTGRSYFHAPFDCVIKRIYGVGTGGTNTIWIQSREKVRTPSFTDYVTVMVIHPNDDTLKRLKTGQCFASGAAMFLEGNDGRATGYHFHISAGRGFFRGNGWVKNSRGAWVLNCSGGAYPPEKVFYVDQGFTKVKSCKGLAFVKAPAETAAVVPGAAYRAGAVMTLQANMNVRIGPAVSYRQKRRSEITVDGRKHALAGTYAVLKKGTRVSIKSVRKSGEQIWLQIPSGWICARIGSKVYVA